MLVEIRRLLRKARIPTTISAIIGMRLMLILLLVISGGATAVEGVILRGLHDPSGVASAEGRSVAEHGAGGGARSSGGVASTAIGIGGGVGGGIAAYQWTFEVEIDIVDVIVAV